MWSETEGTILYIRNTNQIPRLEWANKENKGTQTEVRNHRNDKVVNMDISCDIWLTEESFFNPLVDALIPRVPYYCRWILPLTDKLLIHEWLTNDYRISLPRKGTFYFVGGGGTMTKGYYHITWSHTTSHNLTGHLFHWRGGGKWTIHYLWSCHLIQSLG